MNSDVSARSICVLIVDDEESTRQGLRRLIPWKKLGVSQVEVSSDGEDALRLSQNVQPDIIISDIRMPKMNGLVFAEHLRKRLPDCRLIFISGYSDKEYLKAAIHLQAMRYVEKPIDPEEIIRAVSDTVQQILRNRMLYLSGDKSYLLLKDTALGLADPKADIAVIYDNLSALSPSFLGRQQYRTLIINANCCEEKLRAALTAVYSEILLARHPSGFYISQIALSKASHELPETTLCTLQRVIRELGKDAESVFIAAGKAATELNGLAESYITAMDAADSLFFYGYGIVVVSELKPSWTLTLTCRDENEYINAIREGNRDRAERAFESLVGEIRKANLAVKATKELFYRMNTALASLSAVNGQKLFPGNIELTEEINRTVLFEQLCAQLQRRTNEYFKILDRLSMEKPVVLVIQYIEAHYSDRNLTIAKIAGNVHLSVSHICRIFKEETGFTVNEYLSNYRVTHAKELLDDHNINITMVAEHVGCSDANYFTRLFHKKVGMTPSEYRTRFQK